MKQKVNNIGIEGINPPEKVCNDPKCPWHGHLKVRGRMFKGVVISAKADKTVIVQREFVRYVRKYERYMRVKRKIAAYNPECIDAKEGDVVIIAETRPLSKIKHFVVIAKIKSEGE
ncbi:MAG: 30S ribosomal protein S17 [Candidatus Aenigmarchaeota archaeon]|nr:30S ribosomal protein S17 [Candidatus Aenigmarchaeota archaeon]